MLVHRAHAVAVDLQHGVAGRIEHARAQQRVDQRFVQHHLRAPRAAQVAKPRTGGTGDVDEVAGGIGLRAGADHRVALILRDELRDCARSRPCRRSRPCAHRKIPWRRSRRLRRPRTRRRHSARPGPPGARVHGISRALIAACSCSIISAPRPMLPSASTGPRGRPVGTLFSGTLSR